MGKKNKKQKVRRRSRGRRSSGRKPPPRGTMVGGELPPERVTGVWKGDGVWVSDKASMEQLWWGGYYGKGILSRNGVLGVDGSGTRESTTRDVETDLAMWERVQLSPCEAAFLVERKKLGVLDETTGDELSIAAIEQRACAVDPLFPHKMAVYAHYRSLGWVCRSGIKYGVDFTIYKRGPVYDHAELCLVVQPVGPCGQRWWLSWHRVQGLNRVATLVSKGLALAYVEEEDDGDRAGTIEGDQGRQGEGGVATGAWRDWRVSEGKVRRFVAERERDRGTSALWGYGAEHDNEIDDVATTSDAAADNTQPGGKDGDMNRDEEGGGDAGASTSVATGAETNGNGEERTTVAADVSGVGEDEAAAQIDVAAAASTENADSDANEQQQDDADALEPSAGKATTANGKGEEGGGVGGGNEQHNDDEDGVDGGELGMDTGIGESEEHEEEEAPTTPPPPRRSRRTRSASRGSSIDGDDADRDNETTTNTRKRARGASSAIGSDGSDGSTSSRGRTTRRLTRGRVPVSRMDMVPEDAPVVSGVEDQPNSRHDEEKGLGLEEGEGTQRRTRRRTRSTSRETLDE